MSPGGKGVGENTKTRKRDGSLDAIPKRDLEARKQKRLPADNPSVRNGRI